MIYQDEKYLVGMMNVKSYELFYVVVMNRADLGKMLSQLPPEEYAISTITLLNEVKDYKAFMKELQVKDKPDDLEFGI